MQFDDDCIADSVSMPASIRSQADNEFVVTNLARTLSPETCTAPVDAPQCVAKTHVRIGALDAALTLPHNWTWYDGTAWIYENWVVGHTSIYPGGPGSIQPTGAILPHFTDAFNPVPGAWNNIAKEVPARKGVCAYDLCPTSEVAKSNA